jgi:DNA invertase Pin-like site-specific DNA recombinase
MLVGYVRTSTVEQEAGFEAQRRELQALGCEQIFEEQVSSIAPRPQLANALDFLRVGQAGPPGAFGARSRNDH